MAFQTLPIRRKLMMLGVASAAAALLLSSAIVLIFTYFLATRSVRSDLIAQAEIVADNTDAAVAFGDRSAASEILQTLRAKTSIDLACLYDVESRVLARYPTRPNAAACPTVPHDVTERVGIEGVLIVRPIELDGKRIGMLYLHGNLTDIWRRFAFQAYGVLAGIVFGTLVAVVIVRRLQRIISEPIHHLAEVSSAISRDRNFSLRARKMNDDEIGSLVDAFNDMLGQVQRRDTELSHANADLSREIAERQRAETERSEVLEREREANRVKDEFLAALSHELRTPLNAILGWTQILQMMGGRDAKTARALASIDRNARAQARMIEDLLDVSRIVSGKFHLEINVVDLSAVADTAIDVVRAAAAARNITLTRSGRGERCLVHGDQDRLQQVVWNLLSNAVKFTPRGGAIDVRVEAPEPGVCTVAVRDTGIGIAPEFLPHVFDRFRQADGSMAREHGGLGLGLAIVHDVVQLHGGSVTAFSAGRNRGATFVVRLPRVVRGRETGDRVSSALDRHQLAGVSALVVDDDPDAREIAATALAAAGAEVQQVESAAAALALVERARFSVLVCDIGLPEMDGYALLRRIRESEAAHGRQTPAVAMTAYASADDVAQAHAHGYDAHVAKPFNMATLVNAVASLTATTSSGAG